MRSKLAIRRLAAPFVALSIGLTLGTSCLRKGDPSDATVMAAQVDKVRNVVRVFRRLIGRDPGQAEIAALKSLPLPELTTAILGSAQFDQEGFFNLHRERLLLNREGSKNWVKGSYNDFCAMRLEMSELSQADRSAKGYWELLRYRERWIPIGNFANSDCFFGSTIAQIVEAAKNPQTAPKGPAKSCASGLKFGLPNDDGTGDAQAKVKQWFADLDALPAEAKAKSLLETPAGEALFTALMKQMLLPDFGTETPGSTPIASMALELVKKDGKPEVLQELGKAGNQQCLFRPVDPTTYVKPKVIFGDGDNNGDTGGIGTPSTGPVVVQPPPIDFPPPVGQPELPVLLPTVSQAQTPSMAQAMAAADGALFVKIKMPAEFAGLHASPYWLSRHTSKAKNKHLHRARAIYFGYFCTEINPDAANFQGAPVQEVPAHLKDYFAADDTHAKGSSNCFNCHAKVQPIANWFGMLSFGTPYDQTGNFGGTSFAQFLDMDGTAFYRPGGIYDGEKFLPVPGTKFGMEGMANALTAYPAVDKCVVESTWSTLVGRDFPLFDDERQAALKAFKGGDGGQPSLARLLKHYVTENQRGQAYFGKSEGEFEKIVPNTGFTCPEVAPPAFEQTSQKILEGTCADCHNDGFIDAQGKFSIESYFVNQGIDDTPKGRGNLWQKLLCKVKLEKMPPGGGLDPNERGQLACWLQRMRDNLAKDGKIPADFAAKACQGAAPVSLGAPHGVGNQPH